MRFFNHEHHLYEADNCLTQDILPRRCIPLNVHNDASYIVIIPVRDEEEYIGKARKSLMTQTIQLSVCVVVDNDSVDGTSDVCRKFNSKVRYIKIRLDDDIPGHRQALSVLLGVKHATNLYPNWKYLLKQDADAELTPNYVEAARARDRHESARERKIL